jgi:hypothetical protein
MEHTRASLGTPRGPDARIMARSIISYRTLSVLNVLSDIKYLLIYDLKFLYKNKTFS